MSFHDSLYIDVVCLWSVWITARPLAPLSMRPWANWRRFPICPRRLWKNRSLGFPSGAGRRGAIHKRLRQGLQRRSVSQRLMRAFLVIEAKIRRQPRFAPLHQFIILRIHLFVLQTSPQTFNHDVVEHPAPTSYYSRHLQRDGSDRFHIFLVQSGIVPRNINGSPNNPGQRQATPKDAGVIQGDMERWARVELAPSVWKTDMRPTPPARCPLPA